VERQREEKRDKKGRGETKRCETKRGGERHREEKRDKQTDERQIETKREVEIERRKRLKDI